MFQNRIRPGFKALAILTIILGIYICGPTALLGQEAKVSLQDFVANGNTIPLSDNCVRLTPAEDWSSGSIWYQESIDLTFSFEMELNIMFGCDDESGADGIVFVFADTRDVLGYQGEGMGFSGLQPSLGIEVDTWENDHLADPWQDHIAILQHGHVHHYYNLAGPERIENVEDCELHQFRISWDHISKRLSVQLDGEERIAYTGDITEQIFAGNPHVYWGITAATGRYNNRHEVCFEKLDFDLAIDELVFDKALEGQLIRGDVIVLESIQFEDGSTSISKRSLPDLYRLMNLMKANPGLDLRINGHTDSDGSEFINEKLSRLRALAVAKFLSQQGVEKNRIHVKGYGEKYPLATNDTSIGRMKNRRIEVQLYNPRT